MRIRILAAAFTVIFLSAIRADLNTVTYISVDSSDGNVDGGSGRLDLDGVKGAVLFPDDTQSVDLTGVSSYTLLDGEGGDMWNGGDQFTFLYDNEKATGDFTATVRVVAQTESVEGRWGKAGISARANLSGLSQHAMTQVFSGTGSQVDPPAVGDHSAVPVRIGGRIQSDGNGGVERPVFNSGGAEIPNNVFPEANAGVVNPTTNVAWLRLQYKADTNTFVSGYSPDVDGAAVDWGYSAPATDFPLPTAEDGEGWFVGLGYSAHNSLQVADLADSDKMHGVTFDSYSFVNEFLPQELAVGGAEIGTLALNGEMSDIVVGPAETVPGLAQYWFKGNMRPGDANGGPEAYLDVGTEGNENYPLINPNGLPIVNDTTWFRGSQGQVLTGVDLPNYPPEIAGTAGWNGDQYGVKFIGEVFITEDGEYLIRDGIDDFTMVAIDTDGNGVLDELDALINGDEGSIGGNSLGDVHVLDDDWANLDGGDQTVDYHGLAVIENIPEGGDWRKIEVWMGEDGGGDGAIVYMGNVNDPDIFDDTAGGALSQAERDKFAIKQENLQTEITPIVGGKSSASLNTDVNYIIQAGPDGADQIAVSDLDGALATTLDVAGATVVIQAQEGLQEGTTISLFDADTR